MKRPQGFDKETRVEARPDAGAPPTTEKEPPAAATPAAGRDEPTLRRDKPAADADASATSRVVSPTPKAASLPARDTSAAEARQRAREARRRARRAAAARRAVEKTEVRRFTRRTRHRRAAWITAGVVAVVLFGAVTISVFSPLLSLQTIKVQGTARVDKTAVLHSLDGQIGKPLAMIDFASVKSDLSNFPLIESYVTETAPPHTLVIKITEREPIASVKIGKTFELVDPAGVVIETSPKQPAGVPLVDVKGATVDGKVYRSTAEVLLSLPAALRKSVTKVTASTADDVTLNLSTGEQVVWGSADSSTQKAELLTGLIKSHKATNADQSVEYDVSAPDNGIIRTK